LMQALQRAGYRRVAGVDLAPEAVAIARKNSLNVTQTDVKDFLSENEDGFDFVCAFDLVEHFRKDELIDTLRLIHKRLKPGGTFVFQTPNALSPWAAHYRYGDLTHELILNQLSAEVTLKLTGFENIEVREVAPFVHGLTSAIRLGVWKMFWAVCAIWNLAETGSLHGGVYTRNMMVKANKGANT
jgi:2-polyprenyl-3-methyl-5-hydroxy-6-metoxy-1,4-benzoquinol methylase